MIPRAMTMTADATTNPAAEKPAAQTAEPATILPWRTWPAWLLVAAMVLARLIPSWVEDGPTMLWMVAGFGPLVASFLVVIWWLTLSRGRWRERLLGLLGILALVTLTMILMDKSLRGPATMMLTIPLGIGAFAVGTVAGSHWFPARRLTVALLCSTCGFAASLPLRADGMWGNFALGLHWRWQPSAEERLLASRGEPAPAPDLAAANVESQREAFQEPVWPAFRGAARDGRQRGTLLDTDWGQHPPVEQWRRVVGPAWSSFAVAGSRLFTQEQRGTREAVVCYDAPTGREVWSREVESRFDDPLGGPGPRATPTLAGGALYAQGAQGYLLRLDPLNGDLVWQRDLREVAGREPPMWGFSASPLVLDGTVIVYAGGAGDKGTLGFAADSGELIWSSPAGEHSYSSPQPCTVAGQSLVGMLSNQGLDLLEPATGRIRLKYDWPVPNYRALQPQWIDAESVLLPTGMGTGTRRVRITASGDAWTATEVWTTRAFKPDFNDFVVFRDHLYGFDGAIFCCVRLADGQRAWKGGRYGKGQVLLLEDSALLLVAGEQGEIALVRAEPEGFIECGRIQAFTGKTWNHPVVVGDQLYVRNAEEAACYRLTLQPATAAAAAAGSASPGTISGL